MATVAVGLVAATASPVAAAKAAGDGNICTDYGSIATAPKGFIPRDDLHIVKKDPLAAKLAASRTSAAEAGAAATTRIPVVFHVISKDGGSGGGNLSDARIDAQIDVLNDAFAATGFSFDLQKVTRTVEPEWFNLISANGADPRYFRGSGKEIKMKQALHEGDAETLNMYSASLGQSLLGWAYFPSDFDGSQRPAAAALLRRRGGGLPQPAPGRGRHRRQPRVLDLRRGRHRHARGRSLAGALPHLPERVLASPVTASRTPPRRRRRRSSARRVATPAPPRAWTRSATSWTTPRTAA